MLSEDEKEAIKKVEEIKNMKFIITSSFYSRGAISLSIVEKEAIDTVLNLIEKQQKKIEDYETIEKIEVDNENRLSEEEVLISTMEYYIETNQVMTVPEQENQLIAVKYILNEKNKQINNSVGKDVIREKIEATDNELEEKYSAEKISVFSGNTYMEKFKLIGKRQALQELL